MPLDPLAEQLLAQLAAEPPAYTLTPDEARARRVIPPPGPDVHEVMDLGAPGPEGLIPVRVYRPRDTEEPLPALVWYHGGGFVLGGIEYDDANARRLAVLADCVVVSVGYRLAPEHPYPAAVTDAYAAAVWTIQNAPRMNIDGARVALGGYSAGGNLAAVIARLLRDRAGVVVAHQLLVAPLTDFRAATASHQENAAYVLSPELLAWYRDAYLPAGNVDDPDVAPILAPDLQGLPAATVITAEYDPLRDDGQAYARALEAAGVSVTERCFSGQIHTFFANPHVFPAGQEAVEWAAMRLREVFAG